MTKIFVMAQGRGSRWKEVDKREPIELPSEYKQLIPLGDGRTLISRTLDQLERMKKFNALLVAKSVPFSFWGFDLLELREPTFSILHGILSLRHLWVNVSDIVFLLGDVAFSNEAFDIIFNEFKPLGITFYGKRGQNIYTGKPSKEIYALRVCGHREVSETFFREVLKLRDSSTRPQDLKLWDLYNHLDINGIEFNFTPIKDYTDDIDSPEHYVKHFDKLLEAINRDDKRFENRIAPEVLPSKEG